MNTQFKKIWNIAAAVSMVLASNFAMAADNAITFEADSLNNGTGNYANISSGGTNKSVSIYQLGNGTGGSAAERNQVGDGTNKLNMTGAGTVAAHIGQGATWDGDSWVKGQSTKNNIVSGSLASGDVRVNQNSNGNSVAMNINGSGVVTVNQGYAALGGGGGSGFSTDVTQNGSGAVTINQGNSENSLASSGSATVVHGGTHTVSITQDRTTAGSTGVVKTNTTGDGGSLTIHQSNSGNTFANLSGTSDNSGAAEITGTAVLVNSGTGTLALTQATGTVKANVSGDGTMTINNKGSDNSVFVNAEGDTNNTTAINNGGDLKLNSDGTGNTIRVTEFTAGNMTVNQSDAMTGSTLALNGGSATNVVVNQNGSYQDANIHSVNGSSGTFNLNNVGEAGGGTPVLAKLDLSL